MEFNSSTMRRKENNNSALEIEDRLSCDIDEPLNATPYRQKLTLQTATPGTESRISAIVNVSKAIVGAGSFALPRVYKEDGVVGGTIALALCGVLAAHTIESLSNSRIAVGGVPSYVELSRVTLGEGYARLVFVLTLCASLGVCTSYLVFVGQTLEDLSFDIESKNVVSLLLPETKKIFWEILVAIFWFPLSLVDSYSVFAFTSALGVIAVGGGLFVTVLSGMYVDPGTGVVGAFAAILERPFWPDSLQRSFGSSFGTVAFLFCVNFLTFPIMQSMKKPQEFPSAVRWAVSGTAMANMLFAALCYGFFGDQISDLVLENLGNGPYLSSLKILLCVDLFFTFPVVFNSGKQVVQNALILSTKHDESSAQNLPTFPAIKRAAVSTVGILICLAFAQIGNFGDVVNLVGGVAQGTLAFVMPPVIAISIDKHATNNGDRMRMSGKFVEMLVFLFGILTVTSTTWYSAIALFNT